MADKTLTSISFEGFGIPDKYIVRNISRFSGRRISIIGDSIETFSGYIPNGYVTYYPNAELGITSVDDCWWKKVIDASNAKLEINASYSGGRVTNTGSGPSFYNRTSIIGSPDAIFVTSGVNDSYYNIPLGDYDFDTAYTSLSEATFRTAYIKGVKALKALYPNADIICIAKIMSDEYKNSIRKIADTLSMDFIDASNYNAPYSTGVHPDKLGMNQIASSMMYLSTLNIGYDNETVKVTPQTFTEEQKAQARENIGATSPETDENLEAKVSDLIRYVSDEKKGGGVDLLWLDWVIGGINGTGDINTSQHNRIITNNSIPVEKFVSVSTQSPYQVSVVAYGPGETQLGNVNGWGQSKSKSELLQLWPTAETIRVLVRKNDDSAIKVDGVRLGSVIFESTALALSVGNAGTDGYSGALIADYYDSNGTHITKDRNSMLNYVAIDDILSLSINSPYYISPHYFTANYQFLGHAAAWKQLVTKEDMVQQYPTAKYVCVLFKKEPNGYFSADELKNYSMFAIETTDSEEGEEDEGENVLDFNNTIAQRVTRLETKIGADEYKGNYYLGSDFLKRKVYAKKVGVLKYSQSFCKYNGFWYSARDAGVIAKQDANFNLVTTNDNIVVGHANALQIGIGNVAYSSGWDDDKIHCINLDTLTKDDEIVLPTHGYSTCAVDDYRKLVYIFNRTSYPDTAEHYDFVVYDYENESTLFTAKTTPMFGVMQAVDLYNDHIIVVCDLQRDNIWNETVIRTFDLTGRMVSEISLPEFNGIESEGVFLDRETGDLYIGFGLSTNEQNIYLLSTY